MIKISVKEIIQDHFRSLVNANTHKAGLSDYMTFLILPLVFPGLMLYTGIRITSDSVETIVSGLAIFVGLLFNALVMMIEIIRKSPPGMAKEVAKEVMANISFSILVSLVAVFAMIFCFIKTLNYWQLLLINYASLCLLTEFFVIFLMILKRTYAIFKHQALENGK